MSDFQLFSSNGKFIGDQSVTDEIYQSFTPTRKKHFVALKLAAERSEIAETELRDADAALTEAVRADTAAQSALDKLRPRITPTAAAKAVIAAQRHGQ